MTIRTLDLGGDKLVPYFGHSREANPFMGWRSIRISAAYPEFFQTQLRAILRAAAAPHADVSLLFPMISTLEEVRQLKKMLRRTEARLRADGVPFRENLPVGAMLEVPAAALCIDAILEEVDFVSDRLERPDSVRDGGRPRQPEGGAPVRAVQPAGAQADALRDSRVQPAR